MSRFHLRLLALFAVIALIAAARAATPSLEEAFVRPPDSARPWVFWFWADGNVTRQGITADLEAMKRVGIGGVVFMEVDQDVPKGPVRFMSAPWRELFTFAVSEAARLGLKVDLNNDGGWCGSGGPWIDGEHSMQKVVWTETQVTGSAHMEVALARPERDAGLKDFPRCDADVRAVGAEVWGPCDGVAVKTHAYGRGRVMCGVPLREILAADGVGPDFGCSAPAGTVDFIHRTTADAELYFVTNQTESAQLVSCTFRVTGRDAELWDPVTGERLRPVKVQANAKETMVGIEFAPHQSWFVVFPVQPAAGRAERLPRALPAAIPVAATLSGSWQVAFDPAWGGPASVEFATPEDWTRRPEPGIKFYSGTAQYRKSFRFDRPVRMGERVFLDLGVVHEIAEVRLNGERLGVVWTAPWRIEITRAVRRGDNVLEIAVANLWPNRLIGDAALPPERRLTQTNIPTDPATPLLPSGLLGPVTLCCTMQ